MYSESNTNVSFLLTLLTVLTVTLINENDNFVFKYCLVGNAALNIAFKI